MKILELLTPKRRLGNFGERAAVRYLKRQGYSIICRNFVADLHDIKADIKEAEIDIVAKQKNVMCFVEVKTRSIPEGGSFNYRPAAAVTPDKQRRIISASIDYMRRYPSRGMQKRFDIIEVYVTNGRLSPKVSDIRHLVGAFDKNTAYKKH